MHDRHADPATAIPPLEPGPSEYAPDDTTPIAVTLSALAYEPKASVYGIPLTEQVVGAVAYSRAVVELLPPGVTWGDFCAAVLAAQVDE